MSDPFDTLGVPRRFRLDLTALEQRHRDLSRTLHPDRFAQATPAERRMAIERAATVNDAFRALKNPQSRASALLAGANRPVEETARAAPALLMDVMELREELEEARDKRDAKTVERLRSTVAERVAHEEAVVSEAFDALDPGALPDASSLARAYDAVIKLRYFYRFMEEVEAMDDGS